MILFFISGVLNTDKNFPFGQNQRAPFSHTLNPVVIPIHGLNIYRTDFEQNQSDQETEQGFDQFQDNLLDNFVEELTPQFYSYDSSDSNEYENGNKQGNEDLTIHHSMNEIPSQISVKDYQILEPLTTGSDQDDLNGKVINSNHVSANKPKYDHTDESSFDFMLITFLENLLPKHDFVEKQLNSDHLIKSVKTNLIHKMEELSPANQIHLVVLQDEDDAQVNQIHKMISNGVLEVSNNKVSILNRFPPKYFLFI